MARGGMVWPTEPPGGFPLVAANVETKTMSGFVGCTRISLMARPVNAVVPGIGVVTGGSMGPVRSAVVSALSMRYKPTPRNTKGSPVPTYRMDGLDGARARAPTASDVALSKMGVQWRPPSRER
jgi:hypothetical protein